MFERVNPQRRLPSSLHPKMAILLLYLIVNFFKLPSTLSVIINIYLAASIIFSSHASFAAFQYAKAPTVTIYFFPSALESLHSLANEQYHHNN